MDEPSVRSCQFVTILLKSQAMYDMCLNCDHVSNTYNDLRSLLIPNATFCME